MAVVYRKHFPSKILDYLLVDAWDIENFYAFQSLFVHYLLSQHYLYDNAWTSEGLDQLFRLSRQSSASGQAIEANLIHVLVRASTSYFSSPTPELEYNYIFGFLINQGADIECRYSFRKETALLVVAELDDIISLNMMLFLLRFDADCSAVDYKGRGPLHLALKPSRIYGGIQHLHFRAFTDKLVYLLQAGCSIHAVDDYGRTPTYVARNWWRTKAWEAALREVGKLDCGRSECQCEITVRSPHALRLSE